MVDKADTRKILALEQTTGEWPATNKASQAFGVVVVALLSIVLLMLAVAALCKRFKA
jgi:hypothetical protein